MLRRFRIHRSASFLAAATVLLLAIATLPPTARAADEEDGPTALAAPEEDGSTAPAAPEEDRAGGGAIAGDLLVLRPMGAVVTLAGAVLFIPAALLSAPGGWDNVGYAFEHLIQEPYRETFEKPLGAVD